jgi:formaldehyde-activating enzyme involved in methanogenesis
VRPNLAGNPKTVVVRQVHVADDAIGLFLNGPIEAVRRVFADRDLKAGLPHCHSEQATHPLVVVNYEHTTLRHS